MAHERRRVSKIALRDLATTVSQEYRLAARVADDLRAYYLMGYTRRTASSTEVPRHQGAVEAAGRRVRARRGYNAPTAADVAKARAAGEAPVPEAKAAITRALGTIESDARAQGRPTARAKGDPLVFHRGPSTGNQIQPAAGRVFPRSERIRMEMEADAGAPMWTGAVLDRNGTKTVLPVATSERTDAATGQRWLVADVYGGLGTINVPLLVAGQQDYALSVTSGDTLTRESEWPRSCRAWPRFPTSVRSRSPRPCGELD